MLIICPMFMFDPSTHVPPYIHTSCKHQQARYRQEYEPYVSKKEEQTARENWVY